MSEPMIRTSVRLWAADLPKLKTYYPGIGYNVILRALVRRHLNDLDRQVEKKLAQKEMTG